MPNKRADARFRQWNCVVITLMGEQVTVVLNGQTVIERATVPGVPRRGPIGLQNHGDRVKFRNLFIRALTEVE